MSSSSSSSSSSFWGRREEGGGFVLPCVLYAVCLHAYSSIGVLVACDGKGGGVVCVFSGRRRRRRRMERCASLIHTPFRNPKKKKIGGGWVRNVTNWGRKTGGKHGGLGVGRA